MIFRNFSYQLTSFSVPPFSTSSFPRDPRNPHVNYRTEGKKGRTMERPPSFLLHFLFLCIVKCLFCSPTSLGAHPSAKVPPENRAGLSSSRKHLPGEACTLRSSCPRSPPPCLASILFFVHVFLKLALSSFFFLFFMLPPSLVAGQ